MAVREIRFSLRFQASFLINILGRHLFIMTLKQGNQSNKSTRPVSSSELNSWKRGFTPQAEIWNGRMAIAGLIIILTILLVSNLIFSA